MSDGIFLRISLYMNMESQESTFLSLCVHNFPTQASWAFLLGTCI